MAHSQKKMIRAQISDRGIKDEKVLQALENIDRADFVPEEMKHHAYEDRPLPIGFDQTISQPYVVAYMAEVLQLKQNDKVLEIGSGSGYNAAVLSQIAKEVYSVEIVEWLAKLAEQNLKAANVKNVHVKHGDGYHGWEEEMPFDAIILTAAPKVIPQPLLEQLKIGGKLLAPVGSYSQKLILKERISETEYKETELLPVTFVPMTGEAER